MIAIYPKLPIDGVCFLNIYTKEVLKSLDEDIGWILFLWLVLLLGLFGVKSLGRGGSDLCVVQEGGYTSCESNSAINRSYVHPKPQSTLRRWTKTGHKVSFCYYLSLSHAHTNAHKHEKASRPVLLHSMFVHLFLSAQQEMYASPLSINKHAHTQAKAYTHTHSHTMQNKPDHTVNMHIYSHKQTKMPAQFIKISKPICAVCWQETY